jgi:hypothetical protein
MKLVIHKAAAKLKLLPNNLASGGQVVEPKSLTSNTIKCDLIHNNDCYVLVIPKGAVKLKPCLTN